MNSDQLAALSEPERFDLWVEIINRSKASEMLEVGVWRGEFAEHILANCPGITRYFMLDPWRHLDRWKKPANVEQVEFDGIYAEAMRRTDFAADRRIVLRGRTVDVIEKIPNGSLDIAYIDADHTLKGISIDLMRSYPKMRVGGIIGGDDYSPTIWQHSKEFEPTLVCPFVSYFAESVGTALIIYPRNQFAMIKPDGFDSDFRIIDTTGDYGEPAILPQVSRPLWAHPSKLVRSLSRPFVRQPYSE
jgi:Methyltransferase domain